MSGMEGADGAQMDRGRNQEAGGAQSEARGEGGQAHRGVEAQEGGEVAQPDHGAAGDDAARDEQAAGRTIVYRNSKLTPGWFSSRYTLADSRIQPGLLWAMHKGGVSVDELCGRRYYPHLTREQVQAAIEWSERRSEAARRGWRRRKGEGEMAAAKVAYTTKSGRKVMIPPSFLANIKKRQAAAKGGAKKGK